MGLYQPPGNVKNWSMFLVNERKQGANSFSTGPRRSRHIFVNLAATCSASFFWSSCFRPQISPISYVGDRTPDCVIQYHLGPHEIASTKCSDVIKDFVLEDKDEDLEPRIWGQGLEVEDKAEDLRLSLRPRPKNFRSKPIASKRLYHNDTLLSAAMTLVRFCTFWTSLVASYYWNSPTTQKISDKQKTDFLCPLQFQTQ